MKGTITLLLAVILSVRYLAVHGISGKSIVVVLVGAFLFLFFLALSLAKANSDKALQDSIAAEREDLDRRLAEAKAKTPEL